MILGRLHGLSRAASRERADDLLAAFDLLLPRHQADSRLPLARVAAVCGIMVLAVWSLALRARVWGNPVRFALTEAAWHPQSQGFTARAARCHGS